MDKETWIDKILQTYTHDFLGALCFKVQSGAFWRQYTLLACIKAPFVVFLLPKACTRPYARMLAHSSS